MFYWQDVRYALRLLLRNPLFTLLTITVLAGGLGVSIFTFSFLHTAMLKPLPLDGGADIVRISPALGRLSLASTDAADIAAIRSNVTTLQDLGIYSTREVVVGVAERTRSIQATETEANMFAVTRTGAVLGRTLLPADQLEGAAPVVVLSHWAWDRVFGRDSSIIGQRVSLNGVSTEVVGVMPEGYGFPVASEAWLPIAPRIIGARSPGQDWIQAYGRLRPGTGAGAARAELSTLLRGARAAREVPDSLKASEPTGMAVESFPMAQIGEQAPLVIAVLNTLAGLILLLACINVTNLLLARANERGRETAVRLALGAPRGRLIMQNLWESIILCVAGGALATLIASWGLSAMTAWTRANLEGNMAFWWVWRFDGTVLLAAGAFVTAAITGLGIATSLRAAQTEINAVLQEGAARSGGRREGRVARLLVMIQVAAVSVLLFFGTMSAVVAHRVTTVDLGYETHNLLVSGVNLPRDRYDAAARAGYFQNLHTALSNRSELDGVVLRLPFADIDDASGELELPGHLAGAARSRAFVQAVLGPLSPLGIDLREGRFFDAGDQAAGAPAAIVSASLAARHWPGMSALGRQVRLPGVDDAWRTVVGVVDDVLLGNPMSRHRSPLAVYVPLLRTDAQSTRIEFRQKGNLVAAQAAFHQTLAALDPLIVASHIASFDDILAKMSLMARSTTKLFAGCFGFALLLAISGTYGLMARSIGRRTRELGVRRALGATDRGILIMLLGEGGRQFGLGALAALPITLLVGWGFSRYFPIALGVPVSAALLVAAIIMTVVLFATWIPTRRAVAIEPRDALWRE